MKKLTATFWDGVEVAPDSEEEREQERSPIDISSGEEDWRERPNLQQKNPASRVPGTWPAHPGTPPSAVLKSRHGGSVLVDPRDPSSSKKNLVGSQAGHARVTQSMNDNASDDEIVQVFPFGQLLYEDESDEDKSETSTSDSDTSDVTSETSEASAALLRDPTNKYAKYWTPGPRRDSSAASKSPSKKNYLRQIESVQRPLFQKYFQRSAKECLADPLVGSQPYPPGFLEGFTEVLCGRGANGMPLPPHVQFLPGRPEDIIGGNLQNRPATAQSHTFQPSGYQLWYWPGPGYLFNYVLVDGQGTEIDLMKKGRGSVKILYQRVGKDRWEKLPVSNLASEHTAIKFIIDGTTNVFTLPPARVN
ncbi:hypothetical protein GGX14DRAFT_386737 [Mycena pura]|uniref:Uncharacterized protein n=1 Tax=Mycena pura TaxID=153505 RepID=A0AAD6YR29_9AGAR|nr:hypothetical protein GGX14DRAFT_386737 [Mycena pura]